MNEKWLKAMRSAAALSPYPRALAGNNPPKGQVKEWKHAAAVAVTKDRSLTKRKELVFTGKSTSTKGELRFMAVKQILADP